MNSFDKKLAEVIGSALYSVEIETIQVNIGLVCNQQCVHCHLASSPYRKEIMDWSTMELIIKAIGKVKCPIVVITGGSPELNPNFCRFVKTLCEQGYCVQVRTNLTVLLELQTETIMKFYKDNKVHLVASMPCYLEKNVNIQRGEGVYEKSIKVLRLLNELGYGIEPDLPLALVYNPVRPFLSQDQSSLEEDYKRELFNRFGIRFTNLFTMTNMPIGRLKTDIEQQNNYRVYINLLRESFNPATVQRLMCRYQINIDWSGRIYDCDFNSAIGLTVNHGVPGHIKEFVPARLVHRRISTGEHCFGCTAGCGSSCMGSLG